MKFKIILFAATAYFSQILAVELSTASTPFLLTVPTDLPKEYVKTWNLTDIVAKLFTPLKSCLEKSSCETVNCEDLIKENKIPFTNDLQMRLNKLSKYPFTFTDENVEDNLHPDKEIQKLISDFAQTIGSFGGALVEAIQKNEKSGSVFISKFNKTRKIENKFEETLKNLFTKRLNYVQRIEQEMRIICDAAKKNGLEVEAVMQKCT